MTGLIKVLPTFGGPLNSEKSAGKPLPLLKNDPLKFVESSIT